MQLVIAEALPVHVHQVSDVRHVQSGGGGGALGDEGGGKEGGQGGPQHRAQGLGARLARVVITIRR